MPVARIQIRSIVMKILMILFLSLSSLGAELPAQTFLKSCSKIPGTNLYFSRYEVSVGEYLGFLKGLVDEGRASEVSQYAPDCEVWKRAGVTNDPMAKYYCHSPAFHPYPASGISYNSALAFCEWMTRKYSVKTGEDPDAEMVTPYVFRLPTLEEWNLAARTVMENSEFAGGNISVKDENGIFIYNYRPDESDYAADNYMFTAPVKPVTKQFPADKFGLFHMGGNVSEMTSAEGQATGGSWYHGEDALRIGQITNYNGPESWLGFRFIVEIAED